MASPTLFGKVNAETKRLRKGCNRHRCAATVNADDTVKLWMPDSVCKVCHQCAKPFTLIRRRHHCRLCGHVFCQACSAHVVDGRQFGRSGSVRVCDLCFASLRVRLQHGGSPHPRLMRTPPQKSRSRRALRHKKAQRSGDAPADDAFPDVIPQDVSATPIRRSRNRRRIQSVSYAQPDRCLVEEGEGAAGGDGPTGVPGGDEGGDPSQEAALSGAGRPRSHAPFLSNVERARADSSAAVRRTPSVSGPSQTALVAADSHVPSDPDTVLAALSRVRAFHTEAGIPHLERLVHSLVVRAPRLRPHAGAWTKAIVRLSERVRDTIHSRVDRGDHMDITNYVKIRGIPGGRIEGHDYVAGITVRKNVNHKWMRSAIENPRILILACPLEADRHGARLTSLDTLRIQEWEQTRILVTKVAAFRPDVLLSSHTVSRLALDMLMTCYEQLEPWATPGDKGGEGSARTRLGSWDGLESVSPVAGAYFPGRPRGSRPLQGISVTTGLKAATLHRIARVTGATVLTSLDHADVTQRDSVLGTCSAFRVRSFVTGWRRIPSFYGAEELPSEGDRASAVAGVLSDGGPHPENAAPRGGRSRLAALQSDGEAVRASQRRHGAASGRVRSRPLRLTLAMFEGCQPALGCTLILRGGDSATLREARYVTEFAAQAAYSLRLEAALLAEASLPLPFLRPRGGGGDPAEQSRPFDSEKGPADAADEGQGRGPVSSTPGLEYRDRGVDPAEQKPSKWALMLMERPLNSAWDGRDLVLQNCWIHKSAQCAPVSTKALRFYTARDRTVGQFLFSNCFSSQTKCQNPRCRRGVEAHELSYTHGCRRVVIQVATDRVALPSSNVSEEERNADNFPIYAWRQRAGLMSSPVVRLSSDAWHYSFGKFLEALMYALPVDGEAGSGATSLEGGGDQGSEESLAAAAASLAASMNIPTSAVPAPERPLHPRHPLRGRPLPTHVCFGAGDMVADFSVEVVKVFDVAASQALLQPRPVDPSSLLEHGLKEGARVASLVEAVRQRFLSVLQRHQEQANAAAELIGVEAAGLLHSFRATMRSVEDVSERLVRDIGDRLNYQVLLHNERIRRGLLDPSRVAWAPPPQPVSSPRGETSPTPTTAEASASPPATPVNIPAPEVKGVQPSPNDAALNPAGSSPSSSPVSSMAALAPDGDVPGAQPDRPTAEGPHGQTVANDAPLEQVDAPRGTSSTVHALNSLWDQVAQRPSPLSQLPSLGSFSAPQEGEAGSGAAAGRSGSARYSPAPPRAAASPAASRDSRELAAEVEHGGLDAGTEPQSQRSLSTAGSGADSDQEGRSAPGGGGAVAEEEEEGEEEGKEEALISSFASRTEPSPPAEVTNLSDEALMRPDVDLVFWLVRLRKQLYEMAAHWNRELMTAWSTLRPVRTHRYNLRRSVFNSLTGRNSSNNSGGNGGGAGPATLQHRDKQSAATLSQAAGGYVAGASGGADEPAQPGGGQKYLMSLFGEEDQQEGESDGAGGEADGEDGARVADAGDPSGDQRKGDSLPPGEGEGGGPSRPAPALNAAGVGEADSDGFTPTTAALAEVVKRNVPGRGAAGDSEGSRVGGPRSPVTPRLPGEWFQADTGSPSKERRTGSSAVEGGEQGDGEAGSGDQATPASPARENTQQSSTPAAADAGSAIRSWSRFRASRAAAAEGGAGDGEPESQQSRLERAIAIVEGIASQPNPHVAPVPLPADLLRGRLWMGSKLLSRPVSVDVDQPASLIAFVLSSQRHSAALDHWRKQLDRKLGPASGPASGDLVPQWPQDRAAASPPSDPDTPVEDADEAPEAAPRLGVGSSSEGEGLQEGVGRGADAELGARGVSDDGEGNPRQEPLTARDPPFAAGVVDASAGTPGQGPLPPPSAPPLVPAAGASGFGGPSQTVSTPVDNSAETPVPIGAPLMRFQSRHDAPPADEAQQTPLPGSTRTPAPPAGLASLYAWEEGAGGARSARETGRPPLRRRQLATADTTATPSPGETQSAPIAPADTRLGTERGHSARMRRLQMLVQLPVNTDLKIKGSDDVGVPACRFRATAHFAIQFHALRDAYLGDDDVFAASMARFEEFAASGGKSGASFLRTADERYIIKSIKRNEMQMFLSSALNYFAYMDGILFGDMPSVLVKVLGAYTVSLDTRGQRQSYHFVVMENVFYGRRIQHIYDLKGSGRNRYVRPDGSAGQVLLDDNLMEDTRGYPLSLTGQSKRLLSAGVTNDTKYLTHNTIVDYSLLVGVDLDNEELVVGIIDYLRTYDLAKKLESGVKHMGMIAGQAEPTIIPPTQYKRRFRIAMDRYFAMTHSKRSVTLQ